MDVFPVGLHNGHSEHGAAVHRVPFPRLPRATLPRASRQVTDTYPRNVTNSIHILL